MNRDLVRKRDPRAPIESFAFERAIMRRQDRVIAKRDEYARPMFRVQRRKRREIEMVVMIMRDENGVDRREDRQTPRPAR